DVTSQPNRQLPPHDHQSLRLAHRCCALVGLIKAIRLKSIKSPPSSPASRSTNSHHGVSQPADVGTLVKGRTIDALRLRRRTHLCLSRRHEAIDRLDAQFQDRQGRWRKQGSLKVDRQVSRRRRVGDGSVGRHRGLQRLLRAHPMS
ncbi:hypothetical protein TCAP_07537, partial [Tolypocladium capitatum]